jgi:putative alpha-1,2-mannosidase
VHEGESYTGYSIWVSIVYTLSVYTSIDTPQDTYRAEWAWLILFAPERVPSMITSMLQDYKEARTIPPYVILKLMWMTGRLVAYVEEYCRYVERFLL